jgi:hypothetical protein
LKFSRTATWLLPAVLTLSACKQAPDSTAASNVVATLAQSAAEPTQPSLPCNPNLSAAQCAAADASLKRDARELAADWAALQPAMAARDKAIEAQLPKPADINQQECASQQASLDALHRMQKPGPGEILSATEVQSLPAEITKVEKYIASHCR